MKMKELTAAAGVSKGTILFYIKEGLVPRPIKTHANMAYYTEAHLSAIRLVKELQAKRYLPLAVIKQLIGPEPGRLSPDESKAFADIDGQIFTHPRVGLEGDGLTAGELSRRTGVSLLEIGRLEKMRLLHPVRKGNRKYYDGDDLLFLECGSRLRELGFSQDLGFDVATMQMHRAFLERLVEEEARIMVNRLAGKVSTEKLIRMVEEGTPLFNTMIGLIRKRLIVETTRRFAREFDERERDGEGNGPDLEAG